jgi:hypothetical protein
VYNVAARQGRIEGEAKGGVDVDTAMGKRNDVSVKIDAAVYRKVKTVAAWQGISVAEYLSRVAAPAADRDMAKMTRESGVQAEDGEEEG